MELIRNGKFKYDHDKIYIVLGSGRSGTSFVSESLERSGVSMGQFENKRYHKNKENQALLALNKKILRAAGGDEFDIPSRKKIKAVIGDYEGEIKEFVKKHRRPFWGFKDPRLALTLEFILPYIEGDIYLIYTERDTEESAKSLAKHEGLELDKARKVIEKYKLRILKLLAQRI